MIFLITGATHTGKTVVAKKLIERYSYPALSIDHLKMGLIRSGNTALTPYNDAELTEYLWPIVREMIKTAIENEQDLIIEGCYIPFNWRKDFELTYLRNISFYCLAMSGEYIDAHFDRIRDHACEIEKRLDDSDLSQENLKADNRTVIEGFTNAGEAVTFLWEDAKAREDLFGS